MAKRSYRENPLSHPLELAADPSSLEGFNKDRFGQSSISIAIMTAGHLNLADVY